MLLSSLLFFLTVASPNLGNPKHDTVELVLPAAPIVLTNSSINLGIHDSTDKWDNAWNISTSIYLPNGTRYLVIGLLGGCSNDIGNGTFLGGYTPPIAGLYTILWNITYIYHTSPDNNLPLCGSPPYSSESWLLNRTLTVRDTVNGQTATPQPTSTSVWDDNPGVFSEGLTTITTKLPTEPTGTSGAQNGGSRRPPAWSTLVVILFSVVILESITW